MASSLPRTEVLGFKDVSGQGQPVEIIDLPIFLPWSPVLAAWGPDDDALIVSGDGFSSIYGSKSLDSGSGLFTHQNVLVQKVLGVGGMALVRRLLPEGAAIANTRVWLDIVADNIQQYERNADETFKRTNGALVPKTGAGATLPGFKARIVMTEIDTSGEDGIGKGQSQTGELVAGDGSESTMYPLFDIQARFYGEKGNNIGFRLSAPTLSSGIPVDADLIEERGGYLYRIYALSRADSTTTGSVTVNMDGEQYVEFSLKKGMKDPKTNIDYSYDKRVLPKFENKDPDTFTGYGPYRAFHVYKANVDTLVGLIYGKEKDQGTINGTVTPEQTVNLLGAQNAEGVPYYTYQVLGPSDGGELVGESADHWLKGGSDGEVDEDTFDLLVRDELNTFGQGTVPYEDRASYPMSVFVDTGFSIETKKLMGNIMSVRPDAWVLASTQDVAEPLNTPEEDSSIGAVLRNTLQLIPESEFYGTGACRAVVMKHAGTYLDSDYDGILPFTIDFAAKLAVYMGSAKMKGGYATDSGDYRVVSSFIEHNAIFRPVSPRNKDWQNGITSAEPYDHRKSVFFAAVQTIYHDNTSVLNSFYPMAICCHLNRLGELAWRMFTGDSKLKPSQYADRVDNFLEEQVKDRYDQRADITPKSYYTAADTQRGYSWHTDITGLFNSNQNVEQLTIIAGRQTDTTTTVSA